MAGGKSGWQRRMIDTLLIGHRNFWWKLFLPFCRPRPYRLILVRILLIRHIFSTVNKRLGQLQLGRPPKKIKYIYKIEKERELTDFSIESKKAEGALHDFCVEKNGGL